MDAISPDPIERLEALALSVAEHANTVPELADATDELRAVADQLDALRNPQVALAGASPSFECTFDIVTMRPCEWDVLHPLDGRPLAVVRLLVLGPDGQSYYRAVSPERDRSQRRLIGYWGSLEHAHDGVLALYEQASGRSLAGGDRAPSRPLVAQKPPPGAAEPGRPARPARHSSRA